MPSSKKLTAALRRVKPGNWPHPKSRMKAMLKLTRAEKDTYARRYDFVTDTEKLMHKLKKKYDGLTLADWKAVELESKKGRNLPMVLGGDRVFQSRYCHAKIDMRTLLGLVPPKSVRVDTTSKARSTAAMRSGATKSEAVKAEKAQLAVAAANTTGVAANAPIEANKN